MSDVAEVVVVGGGIGGGSLACALALRFGADIVAVFQAEDAENRAARQLFVGERMASGDPGVFPVLFGLFAGPETIPQEAVDPDLLDRIRAA